MSDTRRRWWRLSNPRQPVWVTVTEIAAALVSSVLAILNWLGRLPNAYNSLGGTLICIALMASAVGNRRRGLMVVSGLLIIVNVLSFGWSFIAPSTPGPSGPREHTTTPGPPAGQRATQTPR